MSGTSPEAAAERAGLWVLTDPNQVISGFVLSGFENMPPCKALKVRGNRTGKGYFVKGRLFRSRFGETPSDVRAEAHRHLGDHPPIA